MKTTKTLLLIPFLLMGSTTEGRLEQSAFNCTEVVAVGTTIAGHTFTSGTVFGNVALNDVGDFAFVAHWKNPLPQDAIFTAKRIVARTGDAIDGVYIESIPLATPLAINNLGQVAFLVNYSDLPLTTSIRFTVPGLFLDSHFVSTPATSPVASVLKDDGQLISEESGRTKKRALAPNRTTCSSPPFPVPLHWTSASDARVAAFTFDRPVKGRTYNATLPYESLALSRPYRLIWFGSDCKPLMVAIGENGQIHAVYTRTGLLASADSDGYLDLFDGADFTQVTTDAFVHRIPKFAINRRGEVLVPISDRDRGLFLCKPRSPVTKGKSH